MIKLNFLCLLTFNCVTGFAQNKAPDDYISSAPYAGKQVEVFSGSMQQAALGYVKFLAVAVSSLRPYGLSELASHRLLIVVPLKKVTTALEVEATGFSLYKQTSCGLATGRRLGEQVSIGFQINYTSISTPFGRLTALSAEMGAILQVSPALAIELHIDNPAGGQFATAFEPKALPRIYRFGCCYESNDNFYAQLRIIKEQSQPVNVQASLQYQFSNRVFARIGINSVSASMFGIVAFTYKKIQLGIGNSYQPILGISPGLQFSYIIKNRGV